MPPPPPQPAGPNSHDADDHDAIASRIPKEATLTTRVLLEKSTRGDKIAGNKLLEALYDELRSLAKARMARQPKGQTIQPTALVHEAYMRLVDGGDPGWDSRAHFFGAAARAMRNILVDRARRKNAVKHGGDRKRVEFDEALIQDEPEPEQMLGLDKALQDLEAQYPRQGEVVMLKYFAGLGVEQIAEVLETSERTVKRDWRFARAWLQARLSGGLPDGVAGPEPDADPADTGDEP
ncbi:MAG: sigma-70 family RNA polymerase sigma factor [Phycisphaerales bacterium]